MNSSQPPALTLSLRNVDRLDNGAPLTLVLDRCGGSIGRAPGNDWTLPDPDRHISSRHVEIRYADGSYELIDKSTNGTFVNGDGARLAGPHRLNSGDLITVGRFEIVATLAAPAAPPAAAASPAPSAAPAPATAGSVPDGAGDQPIDSAAQAKREQMWTMFELSNAVDWARGGFGASIPAPDPAPAPAAEPDPAIESAGAASDVAEAAPAEPPASAEAAEPAPGSDPADPAAAAAAGLDDLLRGTQLERAQIRQDDASALQQAGMLLRMIIAGMVVMLEARARAKSQLGAQGTGLEIEGNNPLKFARGPEQALQYMLNPQERGFMSPERAIEDSFRDLQAHQLATLRAMQGALRATLDRFSPKSIRSRADTRGLFARMLPGSRDAALWKAYETEFSGVAFDSDEAFMDIFAKQFRHAYDEISRQK